MDILEFLSLVNNFLWDYILLFLLCGTGLYLTLKLKFIQLRSFSRGVKLLFADIFSKGSSLSLGMTSFQALSTSIAAQVGTGNLAGVANAIAIGGYGAIFWMWVSAFFGMATIYAEAVLSQKFRVLNKDGSINGGPVYYIKAAFRGRVGKAISAIFAVLFIIAVGFMGNVIQANSIATAFSNTLGINKYSVGIMISFMTFLVVSGGIRQIAKFTEIFVPIMALLYIAGGIVILIVNANKIPEAFEQIIVSAFTPKAVVGGVAGNSIKLAIQKGVQRGLFSNEAGMGTTPHAHAVAVVDRPSSQGAIAVIAVFIDTFIILNITAFVIITTNVAVTHSTLEGIDLTQAAFSTHFGSYGELFIAISLLLFGFSSIIGLYFFARANVIYLFGKKVVVIYIIALCFAIVWGSGLDMRIVWLLVDILNGLLVIPNLLAILLLSQITEHIQ